MIAGRHTALALVGVLLAGAGLSCNEGDRCADCNVILVSIDTLRADHLGCYDYPHPTSPGVDAFREDAALFRVAIAHAPSTEPSHASIFTSLIPAHHGALRARVLPISPLVATMPEILRQAGYRTASFNGGGQVAASFGFDRGFEIYESAGRGPVDRFRDRVSSATRWIEQHKTERFFLFLHSYEVHNPYTPEATHLREFDSGYEGPLPASILPGVLLDINAGRQSITDADLRHIVATYDAEIRSVDAGFTSLLEFLKHNGLYDKTMIVFTSDHGEEFGEHGQVGRHSHALYDELLRVPLIVKFPRSKFAASTVDRQVRSIDILPTILDVLGIESTEPFLGRSLVGLLEGQDEDERVAVSQLDTKDDTPATSIRARGRKLILGTQQIVPDLAYRWFRDKAEIVCTSTFLWLPIGSFHDERTVKIAVDGRPQQWLRLSPAAQTVYLSFPDAGQRIVSVESLSPCRKVVDPLPGTDEDCVSFRIFNPYEFFLVDQDPGERHNAFGDRDRGAEILALRQELEDYLRSRPSVVPTNEPVDVDPDTLRQLKALGYVD